MEIYEAQVLSIVVLGLASILVGLLPACFANHGRRQWPLFLSTILCFGGGVLLSTSIVHILPEMRQATPKNYRDYSEIIFLSGFFLLYVLDEIVHFFYGDTHHGLEFDAGPPPVIPDNVRRHSTGSKRPYGAVETDLLVYGERQLPYNPRFHRTRSSDESPSQLCHVGHQEPCHAAPTANIGLLVALSVHALLEGLAVGLENNSNKVLLLLGAIASHKLVVGFCLGMELALNSAINFCRHFLYIFIFSFGSVAGIAVGMLVSTVPSSVQSNAIPVLQGLAGGTLLYVTVCEIIPRERARWHQQHNNKIAGILQCISVGIGFVLMTVMSKYLDYDE